MDGKKIGLSYGKNGKVNISIGRHLGFQVKYCPDLKLNDTSGLLTP